MLEFQDFLNSSPTKTITSGKIEKLNNQKIITETIDIENQFIKLEGWILDSESNTLDSIYLMIDSKPFLKYDDLYEVDIQNRS